MGKVMTASQIEGARRLRTAGKPYAQIQTELGIEVSVATIRTYCSDIAVEGVTKARTYQPRQGKDGRTIRPYGDDEDAAIVAWVGEPGDRTMNALARAIGRQRHSVDARIRTLRRQGKLPALDSIN